MSVPYHNLWHGIVSKAQLCGFKAVKTVQKCLNNNHFIGVGDLVLVRASHHL